jgi:hypothetical protein
MRFPKSSRPLLVSLCIACAGFAWLCPMLPVQAQTTAPVAKSSAARLPASEKFSTTGAAAQHCPSDTVVWSTFSKSRVFHLSSSKYFGKTRHGAYVCEKDAMAAGFHASKR